MSGSYTWVPEWKRDATGEYGHLWELAGVVDMEMGPVERMENQSGSHGSLIQAKISSSDVLESYLSKIASTQ